jgi:DNA-binding Lrp family transcriptional regulator
LQKVACGAFCRPLQLVTGLQHSLCLESGNELALIAHSMLTLAILLLNAGHKSMTKTLDRLDRRILDELQADARISNQELAKRVGLSPAPCWRRLRRLEEGGFISGYATLLDGPAVGLPILAYALVSLENHHPETVREFDQLVQDRPEVLECHSMSGPNDYLLRIVAASMEAYERFMSSHMLQIRAVRSVNTSFVLRTKKFTTRLPVV